ncbi:MAG: FAD-dependent oxidoreductase [Planctomycetota bacterium]
MPKPQKVLIVGGGISGISAAWGLQKAGIDAKILEARDRIGGRILTHEIEGHPPQQAAALDLGPSWFWPGQPLIAGLLDRFGLSFFAQHDTGDSLFETHTGQVHRNPPPGPMAGALRVNGGFGRLVHALAEDLAPDSIFLQHTVTTLDGQHDRVRLEAQHPGGSTTFEADHVALALPPRLIPALSFDSALPDAAQESMARVPTWMAGHAKFFAVYDTPFWRTNNLNGSVFSMPGPLGEIHDASPDEEEAQGVLFGFVKLHADERQRLGHQGVIDQCVAQLDRLFGAEAAHPRETYLMDWSTEAETATAADHNPPPDHPAYGQRVDLGSTWAERLTPISTETSYANGGLVEGAVHAGLSFAGRLGEVRNL